MSLVSKVAERPERNNLRVGVVSQVTPDLLVSLAGGTVRNPGVVSGYSPVVDQTVSLVRQDNKWLVLGANNGQGNGGDRGLQISTFSTLITTTETTATSMTWDYRTGDRIKIDLSAVAVANGANRIMTVRFKEDGVTLWTMTIDTGATSVSLSAAQWRIRQLLTEGIHTYVVTGQMSAFTGSLVGQMSIGLV